MPGGSARIRKGLILSSSYPYPILNRTLHAPMTLGIGLAALWLAAGPASARAVEPLRLDLGSDNERIRFRDAADELADIQRRVDRGELPKIQFDFDSAVIRPDSYPTLDVIADLMRRNPRLKLLALAHTCIIGTKEYNLDLSRRRAKSVKTYLVKQGIPPPSIRFRGKGFSEPIADNSTEEGRRKNRRVEFRLLKRWWSSVY